MKSKHRVCSSQNVLAVFLLDAILLKHHEDNIRRHPFLSPQTCFQAMALHTCCNPEEEGSPAAAAEKKCVIWCDTLQHGTQHHITHNTTQHIRAQWSKENESTTHHITHPVPQPASEAVKKLRGQNMRASTT